VSGPTQLFEFRTYLSGHPPGIRTYRSGRCGRGRDLAGRMRRVPELGVLPGRAPPAPEGLKLVFADDDGEHRVRLDEG